MINRVNKTATRKFKNARKTKIAMFKSTAIRLLSFTP